MKKKWWRWGGLKSVFLGLPVVNGGAEETSQNYLLSSWSWVSEGPCERQIRSPPKKLDLEDRGSNQKGSSSIQVYRGRWEMPRNSWHPPPISALQQCRKSSHYLQSTEENRFLKNTPTPPTVLRRQRLCSPDLPQIHHSPISFLQSGTESSNLTSSRQGLRHPPHSAFTAILESAWQRPRCSSGPLFLRRHSAEGSQHTG